MSEIRFTRTPSSDLRATPAMKVLIGVGGAGVESLLERAAERVAPGAAWIVAHVTSDETFAPMEGARFALLGRGRRVEAALQRLEVAAHGSAEAILAAADGWLTERGIAHTHGHAARQPGARDYPARGGRSGWT